MQVSDCNNAFFLFTVIPFVFVFPTFAVPFVVAVLAKLFVFVIPPVVVVVVALSKVFYDKVFVVQLVDIVVSAIVIPVVSHNVFDEQIAPLSMLPIFPFLQAFYSPAQLFLFVITSL